MKNIRICYYYYVFTRILPVELQVEFHWGVSIGRLRRFTWTIYMTSGERLMRFAMQRISRSLRLPLDE